IEDGNALFFHTLPVERVEQLKPSTKRTDSSEDIMRNETILAVSAMLVVCMLLSWRNVSGQDKEKPFVQVPDTVSPEARKYLQSLADPATLADWPAPTDVAGWKRAWDAAELASEPQVQATLKRYEPTVTAR